MVEERGNLPDEENLRSNLIEVHSKMRSRLKYKLTNVLAPLIQISPPTKYHYWFTLFLDPQYVMEIKDINTFHKNKNIDTKLIVQKIIDKFYEYIMDAKLAINPNNPHILVRSNGDSLYSHNKPKRMHSLSSKAILLERIGSKFVIYQNTVYGTEVTDDSDVLNWFQI